MMWMFKHVVMVIMIRQQHQLTDTVDNNNIKNTFYFFILFITNAPDGCIISERPQN